MAEKDSNASMEEPRLSTTTSKVIEPSKPDANAALPDSTPAASDVTSALPNVTNMPGPDVAPTVLDVTNLPGPDSTPAVSPVANVPASDVAPPPAHFGTWKFCPLCRSELTLQYICDHDRLACSSSDCHFVHWDNPKPVVVAVVLSDEGVLLTRRKYPPQPGTFCLPGGFVEAHEAAETACTREVEEETGLKVEIVKFLGLYSPTLGGNELVLAFLVKVIGGSLIAGEEVSESTFFPLDNLPPDIGFSQHREIITNWTNR